MMPDLSLIYHIILDYIIVMYFDESIDEKLYTLYMSIDGSYIECNMNYSDIL